MRPEKCAYCHQEVPSQQMEVCVCVGGGWGGPCQPMLFFFLMCMFMHDQFCVNFSTSILCIRITSKKYAQMYYTSVPMVAVQNWR